ncbi:MAG: ABC transporter ATP-binding protein/permease [Acholeplasmataceae bacterium]
MFNKEIFNLLDKNKKYVVYTVILMIINLLTSLGITASIAYGIHILISNIEITYIIIPIVLIFTIIILRYFLVMAINKLKNILGNSVKKDLRNKTYKKISELGVNATNEYSKTTLTQISLEGIEQLDIYYSSFIPQFFYSLIAPVILFLVSVILDWRAAVVLLGCVPLIPISIMLFARKAKHTVNKYMGIYNQMGDTFYDSISGLSELKIYNYEDEQGKLIDKRAEEFRRITMKVLVIQLFSIGIMDLVAFGGAAVGIVFAIQAANTGLAVAFSLFLILIAVEFFLPLRALGSTFHVSLNGASAAEKISYLLSIPTHKWGDKIPNKYEVKIKDLSFSYDGNNEVLKDINMIFKETGLVGIVGKSGCGKSTLANILTGQLRVENGEVLVDNIDLYSLDKANYYKNISIVSNESYIFNDTIRNNFLMVNPKVKDNEIIEAINQVKLSYLLDNNTLDSIILEEGKNLSGGEKQRLILATQLTKKRKLYIFDEATSNIDIDSEEVIMNNIYQLSKDSLVIVISHRLQNIVGANYIYLLEDGRIIEKGNHQELMSLDKEYSTLYKTQKSLETGYARN